MGLRRAMLRNNVRLRAFIKYFDVQYVNGQWYAWFFAPVDLMQEQGLGGTTED